MSFAKFSNDYLMESFTLVDNVFINEYMPYAEEKQTKVYLYGLYLSGTNADATIETFAKTLDMEIDEIINIYAFWEDAGLVEIISKQPFEVKYLSIKRAMQPPKKFKAEKYHDFNKELQLLFPSRMLTPNEYNEYYLTMETHKIQQDAMLMIVQYCINLKGTSVRYPYILTVAKSWASEGVLTAEDVETKLTEYETQSEAMRAVLRALGRKGSADLEEKQYLLKWTKNWGFETDSIVFAAKRCKGKGFKRLDSILDEYYRMGIFTVKEMEDYQSHLERMRNIAMQVVKTIGDYYGSLDHVVEVYISPWVQKGYDEETLVTIAHYCFLRGIKTLSGLNDIVNQFHKLGLLSKESINQFIDRQLEHDKSIKKVLETAGLLRGVITSDRSYYRTWTVDWGFSDDLIIHAAGIAAARAYPIPFINQLLADWRDRNIKTLADAKAQNGSLVKKDTKTADKNYISHNYTPEEVSTAFSNLKNLLDLDDI